jgi:hypothetical protein
MLAVFEAHGNAHLLHSAVRRGDFAMDHDSLEGCSLADELVTLGLGERLLVLVTIKQCEPSSGGRSTRQYSTCGPGSHNQTTDRSATDMARTSSAGLRTWPDATAGSTRPARRLGLGGGTS